MYSRQAFGPNLRRIRVSRGITLDTIAQTTNVPLPLWEAFEDNDLYRWPSGVLARAFVSEYARLIGVDPEETVDEFCRLFPQGDRRRSRTMTEMGALLGQQLVWMDDPPPAQERRVDLIRRNEQRAEARRQKLAGGLLDAALVAVITATAVITLRVPSVASLVLVASLYYGVSGVSDVAVGALMIRFFRSPRPRQRLSDQPTSALL
jgi:hypothetical protein